MARRTRYAPWRGVPCLVLRRGGRLAAAAAVPPDPDTVAATGAQCYERGVYEAWAPGAEVTDDQVMDTRYAT